MNGESPGILDGIVQQACNLPAVRVAVVDAGQGLVVESLRDACRLGFVEPRLIGERDAIEQACERIGWEPPAGAFVPASSDPGAAASAVDLVRAGEADVVMKGQVHTDVLMHALLDREHGLRVPGRRVSHVFLAEMPARARLLGITDAAINIAPDLEAKAQILHNAIELFHLLGVARPNVAVLSAIETVNPAIVSSTDAACLTLMARRGQIAGARVDGPLAFDNAVSIDAAREKGIDSEVAGRADIVLVPDLVSGNILAKNLVYNAAAVAPGMVLGLSAPVVLSSRADPPAARLAALAIAALSVRHERALRLALRSEASATLVCTPQPEFACCPVAA